MVGAVSRTMGKPVVVEIPHELGRVEARRRIEEGLGRLTGQISGVGELTHSWQGDVLAFSLQAIGQTVSGTIAIEERVVRLEVILPGIFAMVANKVKGRLRDEGQLLLQGPRGR